MENIIHRIKRNISSVLPNLTEDVVNSVCVRLTEEIGVSEISDLSLVTSKDLEGLKPIEKRKLIKAWEQVLEAKNVSPTPPSPLPDSSITINWAMFPIPSEKFPVEILNALKAGHRPKPSLKRKIINITAESMRTVNRLPGRKAIRLVSSKIVQDYPVLKDNLCGETFGEGNYSIFKALENRLEYLNRGLSQSTCKTSPGNDTDHPRNITQKISKYGCINWQPDLPEGETHSTQIKKKEEMVQMMESGPYYDKEKMILLIINTYPSQRRDINNCLSIDQLFKIWPAIFSVVGLFKHFEMLVGISLKEKFITKLEDKGAIIVESLKSVTSNKNLQGTIYEIEKFHEVTQKPSAPVLVTLLMAFFKEEIDCLFKLANISTTSAEALKMNLPLTPCLIVCGNDLVNAKNLMLCIDGCIVNDHLQDFIDGFLMLFASFYVFNICYPESASSTLEFLQRCFVSINPEKGSKRNKTKGKRTCINPKVLTLLNLISDKEWLT